MGGKTKEKWTPLNDFMESASFIADTKTCKICKGRGEVKNTSCIECQGTGRIPRKANSVFKTQSAETKQ